jgi:uncharacterized membrane protein YoaK (UPF0700 family)
MFKHKINEDSGLKTYVDWFLLAFLSGSVNTGGWLACHRFVTHVTGFATLAGVGLAAGNRNEAIGMLTVPVYFLSGVMVSAYLIEKRIHEGKKPMYALVMGAVCLLLALAATGGELGWFGKFGGTAELNKDYFLLALLCAASGLQNAALTSASGATVRTTHLTGITTDLGIGLIRAASFRSSDPKHAIEVKSNWLRAGTITAFMIGSACGATLFISLGYLGFVLPAAIALYATVIAVTD